MNIDLYRCSCSVFKKLQNFCWLFLQNQKRFIDTSINIITIFWRPPVSTKINQPPRCFSSTWRFKLCLVAYKTPQVPHLYFFRWSVMCNLRREEVGKTFLQTLQDQVSPSPCVVMCLLKWLLHTYDLLQISQTNGLWLVCWASWTFKTAFSWKVLLHTAHLNGLIFMCTLTMWRFSKQGLAKDFPHTSHFVVPLGRLTLIGFSTSGTLSINTDFDSIEFGSTCDSVSSCSSVVSGIKNDNDSNLGNFFLLLHLKAYAIQKGLCYSIYLIWTELENDMCTKDKTGDKKIIL